MRTQPLCYSHHCPPCVQVFLTFLLIVSSSTSYVIKRLYVGNAVFQLLISSNHAFQVPPIVNDIAAVLPWLLESAPIQLSYCYQTVALNLHFVYGSHGEYHIHPIDAHLSITRVCFNNLLHNFYPITVW